ncbi:MAG: hypothetical protein ACI4K7_02700 [Oscillospiraceae bacterium]
MRKVLSSAAALFGVIWALLLVTVTASAEEIVLYEANLKISPPEGWNVVYAGNMSDNALNGVGKSSSTVRSEFKEYSGYLYGANSNHTLEVFVSRTSDNTSKKIYNSQTGNYQLITDYLNSPDVHSYMRPADSISIIRTSDRIILDRCTFNAVEYTMKKGCGICYSTVVNGDYISVDFRRSNGDSFTDTEKIAILNSINSAEVIAIEEKGTLGRNQIIILCGLGLLLLLLVAAIIIKVKKNKL